MNKMVLTISAAAIVALAGHAAWSASHDDGPAVAPGGMHGQMNGQMNDMGPMLHGGTASAAEVGDIHSLFLNNDSIRRSVTNLADGIRTVTESDDPKIAETIKQHVADMMTRVAQKRDPGLPIESPALRAIFENYDKIATNVETTEQGVIVTQTSADAATVALLQKHAGEVTAFVTDGMAAAQTAMMQNMHGMQGAAMRGPMHGSMRMMMQQMRDGSGEDHSNH